MRRVCIFGTCQGTDVPAALQVLGEVLGGIYGYGATTPLQMEFSDF